MVQVFLTGMGQMGWANHTDLGFNLGLLLVLMLLTAYLSRLPRRITGLTWLLLVVCILQFTTITLFRSSAPAVTALHPVPALVDFVLGALPATRAWSLQDQSQDEAPVVLEPEVKAGN